MNYITMRHYRQFLCAIALLALALPAPAQQHQDVQRPASWENLVFGGRFADRFEPMPFLSERSSETWGIDAVKPRDLNNGIEEAEWSYWGGNFVLGDDGKFHMLVCRWPENHPKGHMAWRGSEVVRATSSDRFGPYVVQDVLGPGHNPEVYRLQDGRYVCYVIDGYYLADEIEGPWVRKEFQFEPRGRRIVAGLSNLSFARREDGSFLMVNRGGGMWVSDDGLGPWEQITQGSNYPQVKGRFEDPVLWKTAVQYHLIVNDWYGRIAYHLRSKDGMHWTTDAGEAYTPGIAAYEDGKLDDWYKLERMKVFQDDQGRAIQANFAVIDFPKRKDLPNDIHSSKNISIPLTKGRLLTLLNQQIPNATTGEIRLRIATEPSFDPQTDLAQETLRFGAAEAVNFGGGARLVRLEKEGDDVIAVFHATGHGFKQHHFAGKLLGQTSEGKLCFGYCRLPWVKYGQAMLSANADIKPQRLPNGQLSFTVEVKNYGLAPSAPTQLKLRFLREGQMIHDLDAHLPTLAARAIHPVDFSLAGNKLDTAEPWQCQVVIDPDGTGEILNIKEVKLP